MGEIVFTRWSGIHPLHQGSFLGLSTNLEKFSVPQQMVFPSWEHPSLFYRYTRKLSGGHPDEPGKTQKDKGFGPIMC